MTSNDMFLLMSYNRTNLKSSCCRPSLEKADTRGCDVYEQRSRSEDSHWAVLFQRIYHSHRPVHYRREHDKDDHTGIDGRFKEP